MIRKFSVALLLLFIALLCAQAQQSKWHSQQSAETERKLKVEGDSLRLLGNTTAKVVQLEQSLKSMELEPLSIEQRLQVEDLYKQYLLALRRIDENLQDVGKKKILSKTQLTKTMNRDLLEILTEEQGACLDKEKRKAYLESKRSVPKEKTKPLSIGELANLDLQAFEEATLAAGLPPADKGKLNQLRNLLLQRQMDLAKYNSDEIDNSLRLQIDKDLKDFAAGMLEAEYRTILDQLLTPQLHVDGRCHRFLQICCIFIADLHAAAQLLQ